MTVRHAPLHAVLVAAVLSLGSGLALGIVNGLTHVYSRSFEGDLPGVLLRAARVGDLVLGNIWAWPFAAFVTGAAVGWLCRSAAPRLRLLLASVAALAALAVATIVYYVLTAELTGDSLDTGAIRLYLRLAVPAGLGMGLAGGALTAMSPAVGILAALAVPAMIAYTTTAFSGDTLRFDALTHPHDAADHAGIAVSIATVAVALIRAAAAYRRAAAQPAQPEVP